MSADTLTPTGDQGETPAMISEGAVGWALVEPDELVGYFIHHGVGQVVGIAAPSGQFLFSTPYDTTGAPITTAYAGAAMVGDPGVGVVVLQVLADQSSGLGPLSYEAFDTSGADLTGLQIIGPTNQAVVADQAFSNPNGYHLEWVTSAQGFLTLWQADLSATGQVLPGSLVSAPGGSIVPYAATLVGGQTLTIQDNQAQLAGSAAVTLPGEPAHALTEVVATGLAGFDEAAVAWADSGTAYVALFDAASDSFGPRITLDWGGASQLHAVGLPDGDFVVSWLKGGQVEGEVFTPSGEAGGVMTLDGQAIGIDGAGDLLTLGNAGSGQSQVIQAYAIGPGGSPPSGEVYTSAAHYIAPGGVTTIHLTGSDQLVQANNAGDIIWSDDTKNILGGGTGGDTFHIGRAGDIIAGGGGNDTFAYATVPWGGSTITDFNAGDVIDLTGMLADQHYAGSDPVADGYLKFTSDSSGDAQIWANYNQAGNDNWWLVATLDGVSTSNLQLSGDTVVWANETVMGSGFATNASDYTVPERVTTVYLTGQDQTIHANDGGDTIWSDDTRNVLIGGAGPDTFHIGRAGDTITGGAGADTFAYATVPWGGSTITDFNGHEGDVIDLNGVLGDTHYTGSDPFADGYLKYGADANGNAQVWADYNQANNSGWWLVATLDGVSTSSLHYSGGLIT